MSEKNPSRAERSSEENPSLASSGDFSLSDLLPEFFTDAPPNTANPAKPPAKPAPPKIDPDFNFFTEDADFLPSAPVPPPTYSAPVVPVISPRVTPPLPPVNNPPARPAAPISPSLPPAPPAMPVKSQPYAPPPAPVNPAVNSVAETDFLRKLREETEKALPPTAPVDPVKARRDRTNRTLLIATFVGILVVPTLIFGVFVILANQGSLPTATQVERANQTPIPSVFSITAPPVKPTVNPPGCPQVGPFGPLDPFTCVRFQRNDDTWKAFIAPVEEKLQTDNHRQVGQNLRYDIVQADPAAIFRFYDGLMQGRGYQSGRLPSGTPTGSGTTPFGGYRYAYYASGKNQVQVLVISLTRNQEAPGTAKEGETIIRMSYTP